MKKKMTDIKAELHRLCLQARGVRDQSRELPQRLAAKPDWSDLTPAAQLRRSDEARAQLHASVEPIYDSARELAAGVLGDAAERLGTARYFREARFSEDATLEELTRIRLALELPKVPNKTLAAMALDAQQRGGDAAAALLTLIRRERDTRVAAGLDMTTGEGLTLSTDLAAAESRFPLPERLLEERDAVAEIARTLDAIESAFIEVTRPTSGYRDDSDLIEKWKAGEPTEGVAKPARVLPFSIVHQDQPTDQPKEAA